MKCKQFMGAALALAMVAGMMTGCGKKADVTAGQPGEDDHGREQIEEMDEPIEDEEELEEELEEEDWEGAEEGEDYYTLKIAGMKGPTSMGLVNLIESAAQNETDGKYEFQMFGAADEIVPLLVKGDLDAAAVPANLAATLYQKTQGQIQVLNINTLGVLYMVEVGEEIDLVDDLIDHTIITTGKGTTPEYVLRYVLEENGIDPDEDVNIEFASEATEASARLAELSAAGEDVVAMLPQPYVTSVLASVEGARVALDMNDEWWYAAGSDLVTGVMVARKDIVEQYPETIENFLWEYELSVDEANGSPAETGLLCEKYGIVAKAALAEKAIPACNIVFMYDEEMQETLDTYLNVLYEADPASIGGALPNDDFYYVAY